MSAELYHELQSKSRKKLDLKINDNRSTMLSVAWEADRTKVSLHRMFLEAPRNIMEELATYINGKQKVIAPSIKAYIEETLNKIDCSYLLDPKKLTTQGNIYNLKEIYDDINKKYFNNSLKLHITWFGKYGRKNRSRVTFGLFHHHLKLIKIHRLLDCPTVPKYVIHYVVFHEMLHYLYPAVVDKKGVHHIHSKEFKREEAKYQQYALAHKWIVDNEPQLFLD
jgi:hypothetical protein